MPSGTENPHQFKRMSSMMLPWFIIKEEFLARRPFPLKILKFTSLFYQKRTFILGFEAKIEGEGRRT